MPGASVDRAVELAERLRVETADGQLYRAKVTCNAAGAPQRPLGVAAA